jgi:site-specific DNA-methyltransferase (adenine-specific)
MTNRLYYGDNLQVLRDHVPDESVDLIYLDPPFNPNAGYNVCTGPPPARARMRASRRSTTHGCT